MEPSIFLHCLDSLRNCCCRRYYRILDNYQQRHLDHHLWFADAEYRFDIRPSIWRTGVRVFHFENHAHNWNQHHGSGDYMWWSPKPQIHWLRLLESTLWTYGSVLRASWCAG